ncbi:MAG: hypothetical protein KKB35_13050, partial [Proteobacteria bacterium]|nr:hypothetical protein [Pseudomonadota bacterium]
TLAFFHARRPIEKIPIEMELHPKDREEYSPIRNLRMGASCPATIHTQKEGKVSKKLQKHMTFESHERFLKRRNITEKGIKKHQST